MAKDAANNCSFLVASGEFIKNQPLTDTHFIQARVHVTRAGPYAISASPINGYSFKATGVFTDTGYVDVRLQGQGQPLAGGINRVRVSFDSSYCEVDILVKNAAGVIVQASNPDHFPLTAGSHWVYDDLTFSGDSVIRTVAGIFSISGQPYQVVDEYKSVYLATNKLYFRRVDTNYFRYVSASSFTSAFEYSPPITDALDFLKENLSTGYEWYSQTWNGRTSLVWQFMDCRYHFRCIDAEAVVTVNGRTFEHVYKIEMIPEAAEAGQVLQPTGEKHTYYFARGVGLVYEQFFNGIALHDVLKIRSWNVN